MIKLFCKRWYTLLFTLLCISRLQAQIDVLHYKALIEPDIQNKSIKGKVIISFSLVDNKIEQVSFSCGSLVVDSVLGNKAVPFYQENNVIYIETQGLKKVNTNYEVEIIYHGKPARGVLFFPDLSQVYTVFATEQWLVCNNAPEDKATLDLSLIAQENLTVIANGKLSGKSALGNHKIRYDWKQNQPVPAYTFGFAIGRYNEFTEQASKTCLKSYAENYTSEELKQIFKETPKMLSCFEKRSGVAYPETSYTQILAEGSSSQEMAGLSIIRNNYGKQVLNNPSEINLSAHEMAHQWWGNRVTCKNWKHFWLNEGFAVFMSSAYKEHRFGKEAYLKDIEVYYNAYQEVMKKDLDKALVFDDWSNPSPEDRTLVYYKGAYVLHLLKQELGEDEFWDGIKLYTQTNFGKSVETSDLQKAMEKSTGRSLEHFFSAWIYK